jgi:hypothetical protein
MVNKHINKSRGGGIFSHWEKIKLKILNSKLQIKKLKAESLRPHPNPLQFGEGKATSLCHSGEGQNQSKCKNTLNSFTSPLGRGLGEGCKGQGRVKSAFSLIELIVIITILAIL